MSLLTATEGAEENNFSLENFPLINFASQNALSLNISTKSKKTEQKVFSITSGKEDLIFISDIRLNSVKQNFSIHDLEKKFNFRGYDFFYNSKGSSRGVGIVTKLLSSCTSEP